MEGEPISDEDIPFEKVRDPTRTVTVWCGGEPREDERKISELCQYCPNEDCPGTYEASSDLACRTLKKWRQDKFTLAEAVRRKRRHEERHNRTDEFRSWVFNTLYTELTLADDQWSDAHSELTSFAARVAKGQTAFGARRRCGDDDGYQIGEAVLDPVSDDLCTRIEEKRHDLVDGSPFEINGAQPVAEGETYDVEIIGIGGEGDGIAKIDGYVLVVPDTSIGDHVTVKIESTTPNVAFTSVVNESNQCQNVAS